MEPEYKTRLPEWTWTDNRDDLPEVLNWSGGELPPVGYNVSVDLNDEWKDIEDLTESICSTLGRKAMVAGYLHENGNLRVVVFLYTPPEELKAPNGSYPLYLLGNRVFLYEYWDADEEVPKPSLLEHNITFMEDTDARMAIYVARAAALARAAARAADTVALFANQDFRTEYHARVGAAGDTLLTDEDTSS